MAHKNKREVKTDEVAGKEGAGRENAGENRQNVIYSTQQTDGRQQRDSRQQAEV
jgi:hypothetical protein